ncbi:MAG TPA: WD40 repeat domain-containing serine/threonine protein kinase [Nannocystaceae bacterium]|nr:WD40 repeat domain-containing serine/threonine protein kinase [Nannocystaceae bacterium]
MSTPGKPLALDVTAAAADTDAGPQPEDATPEPHADTLLAGVDTAQLRNAVQAKIFGTPIEPVRIGRYTVLRRIGRGGMGVVYSAYDDELDRKVAIKLISPGADEQGGELWTRLRREAKALARLSDPAIVQVYEVGEHDGRLYVAMEFVDGMTLRQWLAQEQHDTREILAMFVQAARGLAAAHRAGLVHRDFKPDNAMISPRGGQREARVRVLDFGLAAGTTDPSTSVADVERLAIDDAQLTRTGLLLGTPAYMAPEQIQRSASVDARADQFAFCVALFEALWGQRPFRGRSIGEVTTAIAAGDIVEPAPRVPIPARVRKAILRGLQHDPALRHASMDALVGELEHRSRVPFVLALVLVLGVVAVLAWSWYRESARAEQLGDEIADAEQALGRSADELVLAEARERLADDPTDALVALQRVTTLDGHMGEAWAIAARASALGPALDEVSWPGATHPIIVLGDGRQALVHRTQPDWPPLALLDVDDGELHPLDGHYGTPLAVDPDGTRVLTTLRTKGIELTRIPEGDARMITTDEPRMLRIADEAELAVGIVGGDHDVAGQLIAWRLDDGTSRELGDATFLYELSPDGTRALVSAAHALAIVDTADGKRTPLALGDASVGDAVLPAGVLALDVFGADVGIGTRLVRLADGAQLDPPVFGELAFDPSGTVLAAGMMGSAPRFVDVTAWSGDAIALAGPSDSAAYGVMWSPAGTRALGCSPGGTCSVWSWKLRRHLATLRGLHGLDDAYIGDDGRVVVQTTRGGSTNELHDEHGDAIGTFAVRPTPTIRTWIVRDPPVTAGNVLALAGDESGLVTLVRGGAVQTWGDAPRELTTIAEHGAVALDAAHVVLADDRALRVIDRRTDAERSLRLAAAESRRHVMLAPGTIVSWDHERLAVIDIATLRERWSVEGRQIAAIAGDRLCHATRGDTKLRCVALADGQDAREHSVAAGLEALGGRGDGIEALAGTRDGERLAVAQSDGYVVIVALASGSQHARALPRSPGRTLAFSPDGRVLAIADMDGALTLWNIVDDAIADSLMPQSSAELDDLRRPALQRIAFTSERSLVAVDAWGNPRALELPPAGDPAALREWITTTTHARP